MTKKKSKKDIKAERKMLVSVIEKAVRSEKENSLDDFPALVVANERRIKQLNLTPGVKLSQEGEWRWRGIKEHLGLQKKGNYWLPSRGSNIYKRNQLFEVRENLLARPNNLPILDVAIIVKHYLDHSLKWLEKKIEEDHQNYVQPSSENKLEPDELISEESNNASKPKIERQDLALLIWKACQDLEKKYDKKVTASELWNYLISTRSEYDPEGMIISKIDTNKIEYFRGGSGDSPTSLTRSTFSQKLSRLRKNPPETLI
tara:strand:+ start:580 stop:1356 length:777 start_codon:yes stop_codon:yes gene_type:complete